MSAHSDLMQIFNLERTQFGNPRSPRQSTQVLEAVIRTQFLYIRVLESTKALPLYESTERMYNSIYIFVYVYINVSVLISISPRNNAAPPASLGIGSKRDHIDLTTDSDNEVHAKPSKRSRSSSISREKTSHLKQLERTDREYYAPGSLGKLFDYLKSPDELIDFTIS